MSIKDLTDKPRARLPRLGQLRKGAPKPENSKSPGKDLTYFRFVCGDPSIVKTFSETYDEKPRIINVLLPYPILEENLSTWREEHGAGSLKHRCDGETMVLWQDESGVFHTEPKPCPYKDLPKGDPGRKCKETGELHVIIPELGRWGYIQVVTGSIWDCLELTDNMVAIEELAQRVSIMTGRPITMQGIPCLLKRAPRMISTPNGNNPRVRREKWLLHLEVHPEYMKRLAEMSRQFALPITEAPQLEAPDLELDYDPGEVNGGIEYPETEILDDESEPVEEPQATNGKWPARPWDAETCRAALNKALEKIDPGRKALKTHQKAALIALNKLALGDDEKRHKLTWFLFGTESSKELAAEQCAVITDKWTQVGPPDFEPCPASVEEAKQIFESLGFEEPVEQEELPF